MSLMHRAPHPISEADPHAGIAPVNDEGKHSHHPLRWTALGAAGVSLVTLTFMTSRGSHRSPSEATAGTPTKGPVPVSSTPVAGTPSSANTLNPVGNVDITNIPSGISFQTYTEDGYTVKVPSRLVDPAKDPKGFVGEVAFTQACTLTFAPGSDVFNACVRLLGTSASGGTFANSYAQGYSVLHNQPDILNFTPPGVTPQAEIYDQAAHPVDINVDQAAGTVSVNSSDPSDPNSGLFLAVNLEPEAWQAADARIANPLGNHVYPGYEYRRYNITYSRNDQGNIIVTTVDYPSENSN